MVHSCSVPHCGDQSPILKIYAPIPRRRDSRAISRQRHQYFPELNGHILVSGGFHTQNFCFYLQQFLMERSREETLSKVNSMGIENLPSQVRLMIHPARILLFPAAFGARWWSLFLQIALTPVNLPNLLGINLCFPPPKPPPLGDMDFLSLLPRVQGLSCFSFGFVLFKLHAILFILSGHLIDMPRCLIEMGHPVAPKPPDDQGFGDLDSGDLIWG